MLTDIEIAQQCAMKPITEIASELNIRPEELEPYGHYKAKLSDSLFDRLADRPNGKLVLVTAINPTPAGEGKTTTTVGLGQAMKKIGKNAIIALREPSLGPVFGIKGGAAGGGYAQVVPMEDINLHFTGDMHAITAANNLLCAILDNHLQQGNELGIDPRRVLFKRCMDMNDRALRNTIVGLGGKANGVVREDGFQITVASEVMAILCLAADLQDLKERLGNILVAYTYDNKPVYAKDLKVNGSMAVLLKDAIKPNLVQTLENTPALMHGGPFANIAHGCNSITASSTTEMPSDRSSTHEKICSTSILLLFQQRLDVLDVPVAQRMAFNQRRKQLAAGILVELAEKVAGLLGAVLLQRHQRRVVVEPSDLLTLDKALALQAVERILHQLQALFLFQPLHDVAGADLPSGLPDNQHDLQLRIGQTFVFFHLVSSLFARGLF